MEMVKEKPLCNQELSEKLHLSYIYVNKQLNGMKRENLVAEDKSKYDARKKIIYPTKKGVMLLDLTRKKKGIIIKVDGWLGERFNEIDEMFDNLVGPKINRRILG